MRKPFYDAHLRNAGKPCILPCICNKHNFFLIHAADRTFSQVVVFAQLADLCQPNKSASLQFKGGDTFSCMLLIRKKRQSGLHITIFIRKQFSDLFLGGIAQTSSSKYSLKAGAKEHHNNTCTFI